MSFQKQAFALKSKGIIEQLNKRNMQGYYCENSKEAVEKALSIMEEGSKVAWGGSVSLNECGLLEAISQKKYQLIDRNKAQTAQEKREVYAATTMCDYFLMSTNAITLEGELVNIDGTGNRVAPLIYGPSHVIMIVGMNKVTKDVDEAIKRIRIYACPPNAIRLGKKMPCSITGKCGDCYTDDCFCNQIVTTRRSGQKDRIHVILVGEELGY